MLNFSFLNNFEFQSFLKESFFFIRKCMSVFIINKKVFILFQFDFQKNTYKFFKIFRIFRRLSKIKSFFFIGWSTLKTWLTCKKFGNCKKSFSISSLIWATTVINIFFIMSELFSKNLFWYSHPPVYNLNLWVRFGFCQNIT